MKLENRLLVLAGSAIPPFFLGMAVLSDSMHCLMVGALSTLLHHEARQAQPPALSWLTCQ